MEVLKQTSPLAEAATPKAAPRNIVPSSRARMAFIAFRFDARCYNPPVVDQVRDLTARKSAAVQEPRWIKAFCRSALFLELFQFANELVRAGREAGFSEQFAVRVQEHDCGKAINAVFFTERIICLSLRRA